MEHNFSDLNFAILKKILRKHLFIILFIFILSIILSLFVQYRMVESQLIRSSVVSRFNTIESDDFIKIRRIHPS